MHQFPSLFRESPSAMLKRFVQIAVISAALAASAAARADTALIAEQGRSAGVHLVILTQNPLADNYGYGATGGTLRRNLKARVHFDRDADALTMVFKGAANRIPDSALTYAGAGIPGRAIYVYLDPADGGRPTAGQMWFLQPEQALKIARLYRGPTPRTFYTPTRVTEYR